MRRLLLPLFALLAAFAFTGGPVADRNAAQAAVFGYGDQNPEMFSDPLWQDLPLKRVRRLVDWDTKGSREKIRKLDAWMAAAREAGATPLLSIDRSYTKPKRRGPSVRQYRSLLGWLEDRYPWWRELTPWNEANHSLQPTWKRPELAAAYYRAAVDVCERCRVTSPVILAGQRGTDEWIERFKRSTKNKVRLWTVHAYGDHNRGTDKLLTETMEQLPGHVWVTEAAGWVKFLDGKKWPYSERRAARAIKQIFTTAKKHDRKIKRWYFYQWRGNQFREHRWDSGVLNFDGSKRRGYTELVRGLRQVERRKKARRAKAAAAKKRGSSAKRAASTKR